MDDDTDANAATEMPTTVRALLWEYDADAPVWTEVRDQVIKRLLFAGRWDDVRWLSGRIGDETARAVAAPFLATHGFDDLKRNKPALD